LISCIDCQLVKKVYHDRNDRIFIAIVHRESSFAKEIISKYDLLRSVFLSPEIVCGKEMRVSKLKYISN
jgi:hypothetical protein